MPHRAAACTPQHRCVDLASKTWPLHSVPVNAQDSVTGAYLRGAAWQGMGVSREQAVALALCPPSRVECLQGRRKRGSIAAAAGAPTAGARDCGVDIVSALGDMRHRLLTAASGRAQGAPRDCERGAPCQSRSASDRFRKGCSVVQHRAALQERRPTPFELRLRSADGEILSVSFIQKRFIFCS